MRNARERCREQARRIILFAAALCALLGVRCGSDTDSDPTPPISNDQPPRITSFSANPDTVMIANPARFSFRASDDYGIDSAVLSYGDGARSLVTRRAQQNVSATLSRAYLRFGTFTATLYVYDTQKQVDVKTTQIVIQN